ncbi:DUF4214 domain-containing protein [Pseudoduganella sp. FT26W]|uniref:DUF4214 domain-containing protein n=1 Tax=Duganella aquatilis TaxID=2666082 RepID=A0A844D8A2_9BURK|nr:DUF4214 domain-containing protein [Duganella aquatilis]
MFSLLDFWNQKFSEQNLPLTAPQLLAAYSGNAQLRATLDAFAASTEFSELYAGNQASFVNALYLNAFNRNVEAGGLLLWAGLLNSGQITPAQAVLHIVTWRRSAWRLRDSSSPWPIPLHPILWSRTMRVITTCKMSPVMRRFTLPATAMLRAEWGSPWRLVV